MVGESGTHGLASCSRANVDLELPTERNWNLRSLFYCDEENSLVPRVRTFVESVALALGFVPPSICAYV